jgi:hypothetical protein
MASRDPRKTGLGSRFRESGKKAALTCRVAQLGLFALVSVAMGCTTMRPAAPGPPTPLARERGRDCRNFFDQFAATVHAAGVGDAGSRPVAGFPYLRVNRFLASFRDADLSEPAFQQWVGFLQGLARRTSAIELANLSPTQRGDLARLIPLRGEADVAAALQACGELLRAQDLGAGRRAALREAATVPPDYRNWARAVGLYPLTAIPFHAGIVRLQRQTGSGFGRAPQGNNPVRFFPSAEAAMLSGDEVRGALQRASQNPLHIPELEEGDSARLMAAFAPVFEVDVASDADRIGAVGWSESGKPAVDTSRPIVYTLRSHTRFGADILLQLNYVIWFPARPKTSGIDLLGGYVDGITWRVTLAADGRPLIFDAIHNCGCYHLFFPTVRLRQKPAPATLEETAFVPLAAPPLELGQRLVVHIESGTHYIRALSATFAGGAVGLQYQFADYDQLRSLPRPDGGHRSLFDPDGIVAGTERGERYLFWPMGVADSGAMRQWGRHATAFIGRRHFDDPDLFDKAFEPAP